MQFTVAFRVYSDNICFCKTSHGSPCFRRAGTVTIFSAQKKIIDGSSFKQCLGKLYNLCSICGVSHEATVVPTGFEEVLRFFTFLYFPNLIKELKNLNCLTYKTSPTKNTKRSGSSLQDYALPRVSFRRVRNHFLEFIKVFPTVFFGILELHTPIWAHFERGCLCSFFDACF